MEKNVFFKLLASVFFVGAIAFGVSVTPRTSNGLSDITLRNIEALTKNEQDCPGGHCKSLTCEACCPPGTKPYCSLWSCYCN